ncbi:MAG: hypothetical protein QF442_03140 [Candidatus Peribacteraceae bacterium]|jgi:hypothetical protein|nr:hypothetical protein [Candidatus Peribacteraceae bacterium]|tara:strand:- start:792 stop:929 length:138 start_codon:yes stop_codon:yes gene_type:complete
MLRKIKEKMEWRGITISDIAYLSLSLGVLVMIVIISIMAMISQPM